MVLLPMGPTSRLRDLPRWVLQNQPVGIWATESTATLPKSFQAVRWPDLVRSRSANPPVLHPSSTDRLSGHDRQCPATLPPILRSLSSKRKGPQTATSPGPFESIRRDGSQPSGDPDGFMPSCPPTWWRASSRPRGRRSRGPSCRSCLRGMHTHTWDRRSESSGFRRSTASSRSWDR
jgi:hypothetical protein